MTKPQPAETCAHCKQPCTPALYLADGETLLPLCPVCGLRWLLSDDEWPPEKPKTKHKTPTFFL